MVPGLNVYATVRLKLPRFALLVLRRRAKRQRKTISDVLEMLIWEDVWMDEVKDATDESPEAAKAFKAWFAFTVTKGRKK